MVKSFEQEAKEKMKFEEIHKLLIDDFNWIAEEGQKRKRNEDQIDSLQELYVRHSVVLFLNALSIPKGKKLDLLQQVKDRLR